jgi:predicted O-methyltransferase YrrM
MSYRYGRVRMLGQVPRLATGNDSTSRALLRAMRTEGLGRATGEERAWIARIEERRRELAADGRAVYADFESTPPASAGSFLKNERPGRLGNVSLMFSIPPDWGRFQLRMVRELAPRSCLELGSGVGLSAAYQAAAMELNGRGRLTTLEGARTLGEEAKRSVAALGLDDRVAVRLGPIDETLPEVLPEISPIDYAFLDAEHSEEATWRHFRMIAPHVASGGVVVLDDVTFTDGMRRAWSRIAGLDRVALAMRLGRVGVVALA